MLRDMEEVPRKFSVPALGHGNRRVNYRTAAPEGRGVYELGPRGRLASNAVEPVIEEVLSP